LRSRGDIYTNVKKGKLKNKIIINQLRFEGILEWFAEEKDRGGKVEIRIWPMQKKRSNVNSVLKLSSQPALPSKASAVCLRQPPLLPTCLETN
jgi:hypothetical protein